MSRQAPRRAGAPLPPITTAAVATALAFVTVVAAVATAPRAAAAGGRPGEHRLRVADFAASPERVHALAITGAPHLTTSVRFPAAFAAAGVACGSSCVDVANLQQGGGRGGANWIVDLRPSERTLHLWPASLPSADNPPSAFASNIYVALEGSQVVNLALRLVDAAGSAGAADAVVDVRLPALPAPASTDEAADAAAVAGAAERLRRQLGGKVRCRTVHWAKPYRHVRMVVRLQQICASAADEGLQWLRFSVENRAHAPLLLEEMRLLPEQGGSLDAAPPGYVELGVSTQSAVVLPGATTLGVAAVQRLGRPRAPTTWTLRLASAQPRHERVEVQHLVFPEE